jgi:hypothetical protein
MLRPARLAVCRPVLDFLRELNCLPAVLTRSCYHFFT